MNKTIIRIINIVLIVLSLIGASVTGLLIYYKTAGKDKIPQAITSTYVTQLTNPNTGEKLSAIEASYYQNKNNKGYEVIELLFNSYSGVNKQAIYSRGFQLVYKDKNNPTLYYYDRYDGVSFETGHEYKFGDKMIIDINGESYAIALDGKYTTSKVVLNTQKLARSILCAGFNFILEDTSMYYEKLEEHEYTFEDLLVKIGSIIKSSSNNTGDSIIPLIDLGDFLHVYELDSNGVPKGEPIGDDSLKNSYFTMDTHYDTRGMVWSKQSMFNSVSYDSNFNISGLTDITDYWKSTAQIILTEDDFIPRSVNNGYYSLSLDKVTELKKYDSVDIVVDFNIDNIDNVEVLGFDYYAFYGLELKELNISSSNVVEFELLLDCLKDSGINTINTENIILINNSGVTL